MKAAATIAAVLLPESVHAQPTQSWPMHDGWYWWMPFHGLFPLLTVAVVVVGIVFLIRYLWHGSANPRATSGRSAAIDQLDGRYARGEIDRDEYLQRKRDLVGE